LVTDADTQSFRSYNTTVMKYVTLRRSVSLENMISPSLVKKFFALPGI
jgi:hypothetical protein